MPANRCSFTVVTTAAAVVLALLAAGCGGSSGPRVASVATTPTRASATATTPAGKLAAYYRCMAAHGFPNYRMPAVPKGSTPGAARIKLTPAQARTIRSPGFQAADRTCGPLIPGYGSALTPAREAAARAQALKFSQCARSHGMADFPDPDSTGAINLSAAGIESPAFLHVKQACRRLIRLFIFVVQPQG
jgi:hypothetical protein